MDDSGTVLVIDDQAHIRRLAEVTLTGAGFSVLTAEDGERGLDMLRTHRPDVVLLDRMMPGMSGDAAVQIIKDDPELRHAKVIILSAKASTRERVEGLNLGVDDYLTKPYEPDELVARVRLHVRTKRAEDAVQHAYETVERQVAERTGELTQANEALRKEIAERKRAEQDLRSALDELEQLRKRLEAENIYLQDELRLEHDFTGIVTRSRALKAVLAKLEQVAPTDATVLILGESGTGKELLARAVHNVSKRSGRPLVKVNCATLPANLIESELFGHEKGAFTGALERKIGRFELADGGTIFLDEIGDLALNLQTKLLRVLQEGEFERLGNSRTRVVDVRVIAATNRDLDAAVANGEFREDLFYRLNVFPLLSPPLRERKEDVPLLVEHFVRKYAPKTGKRIESIPQYVMDNLMAYSWPGNVRELENIIERAVILTRGTTLEVEELVSPQTSAGGPKSEPATLKDMEQHLIQQALKECNWLIEGKRGAAARLGMPPSTLRRRMQSYGMRKPG